MVVHASPIEHKVGFDFFLAAVACQHRLWQSLKFEKFKKATFGPTLGNKMMLVALRCEMEVDGSNSWLVTPAPAPYIIRLCISVML